MSKQEYDSLGSMIKSGDFPACIEKLKELKGTDDMEYLQLHQHGLPSELDELLLRLPAFIYKADESGKKSLHEGVVETVNLLLELGANPNAVFKNGVTPFMTACEVETADLAKLMVNNKTMPVDLEQGDGKGNRPLFYATLAEATEVMDFLVKDCQVNVDFQYILSRQQTVFHYACGQAKEKSIDKLIELNANPTLRDNYENLPAEMIPAFDEEIHDEDDITPEELKKWDSLYEKMVTYTKQFENNKKVSKKLNF